MILGRAQVGGWAHGEYPKGYGRSPHAFKPAYHFPQDHRVLIILAFFVSPLQGDFIDEIAFPGVTPFGLTPGCNISPLQGDFNAIILFLALILNVNHF